MIRCLMMTALMTWLPMTAFADDKAQLLSTHLPAGANSVSVIHLDQILHSQKGSEENWTAAQKEMFEEGRSGLPPWLKTLVVGSLVRPSVPEEVWAAGLFELAPDVSFSDLSQYSQSRSMTLEGKPAFLGSSGALFVQLEDRKVAAHRPGYRQEMVNWLESMDDSNPSLTPYLQDAVALEDQVVMSIDLQGMFDSEFVETYLEQDERFARQRRLIPELIPLLSGLRGVTMTINIAEETECDVWIDFSEEVGPSAAIAKTLFLTAMEDSGAHIEEFQKARIAAFGERVRLRCPLSEESLQRILSLIVPPRVSQQTSEPLAKAESTEETSPEQEKLADQERATHRYVDGVTDLVSDLRRASQNISSYKKTIAWHQTYANKIEKLPTKNVPDEVVSLGEEIAQKFRALARSLQGQSVKINARERSVVYNYDYKPGAFYANIWGGAGYRPASLNVKSNLQQVRQKQAEAVEAGSKQRLQIWEMIERDVQKMRDPDEKN